MTASVSSAIGGGNLVQNGNFNGGLPPWIAASGGPSVSGGVCLLNNASIRQVFPTTVGHLYYFSYNSDVSPPFTSITFSVAPGAGGANYITGSPTTGNSKTTAVFGASTDSAAVTFAGTNNSGGFAAPAWVDNVVVIDLTTSALVSKYNATITEIGSLSDHPLTNKVTHKAHAIIDGTSDFYLLDVGGKVYAGTMLPDGSYSIRANGIVRTGNAVIKGARIEFSFSDPFTSNDDAGSPVTGTTTTSVVLTKAGKLPED